MSLSDEDMAGGMAELTDFAPVAKPVPPRLAESEISDLLSTTDLEAPTPPCSRAMRSSMMRQTARSTLMRPGT